MNACPCCAHTPVQALPEDTTWGVAPRASRRCERCGHVWSLVAAPGNAYYQSLVGRNASDQAALQAKVDGRIASLRSVLRDGLRVLEVGCAEGALGQRIKQAFQVHYVGLEPSRDAETASRVLDRVHAGHADLLATDPDARFDLILSFHVLEHIPDVAAELAAWGRLCTPATRLILEVPHEAGHPLLGLDRNAEHVHQFSTASMATLLQRHGFTVEQLSTGHFESTVYPDSLRLVVRSSLGAAQRRAALMARLEALFPDGFAVYGVGGDFHNYLLPLLPMLAPGRLRALHDSNAELHGRCLPTLPALPIKAFANQGLPVLIASARFGSAIRQQLVAAGMPASLLFDLSDLLGPLPAPAAA
jgi:SAM-dependent methyltransferase